MVDEKTYRPISGWLPLVACLALVICGLWLFCWTLAGEDQLSGGAVFRWLLAAVLMALAGALGFAGFMAIAPNDSRVLLLFGEYKGSVRDSGFFWVNPFFTKKKLSLRIRNFETGSITTPEKKDAAGLKQGSGDEHLWELANLFSYEWNRKSWTPYAGGRATNCAV